jgi:phosphoribosylglycinamide formyltransferase-1
MLKNLVILASGNGSLAQAIIDSSDSIGAKVIAVVCDNPAALVLERAASAGIPTQIVEMKADRKAWDTDLIALLRLLDADLVLSAGFMRILSPECVNEFKVINSHPALLPLFPGAHAVRDALSAGATHTGTTIHWVDSGVDTGKIIAQERVEITPGDDEDSLHERIKIVERRLYVETLKKLLPTLESADV